MKFQSLFSGKNRKSIVRWPSAEVAETAVKAEVH